MEEEKSSLYPIKALLGTFFLFIPVFVLALEVRAFLLATQTSDMKLDGDVILIEIDKFEKEFLVQSP